MDNQKEKELRYKQILRANHAMLCRVCYVYADEVNSYEDLYQEIAINLWENIDSFRGDAKMSTWLYRLAINTCLTTINYRKSKPKFSPIDNQIEIEDNSSQLTSEIAELYNLISRLDKSEKAIIMLWLDDKSYDEIASVIGISKANVAVRLHRIKSKLYNLSES